MANTAQFDDSSTLRYEFANGHKPRGRGQWAFDIDGDTWWAPRDLTFTEAKKAAMAEANSRKARTVKVCS